MCVGGAAGVGGWMDTCVALQARRGGTTGLGGRATCVGSGLGGNTCVGSGWGVGTCVGSGLGGGGLCAWAGGQDSHLGSLGGQDTWGLRGSMVGTLCGESEGQLRLG